MKTLIVANWKMNPQTLREAKQLFDLVKRGVKNIKKAEVVICPPFVYLSAVKPYNHKVIKLGSQNVFWEKEGAYTGEISPAMLKDFGCQYVIIGHSERRRYFKETDEMVNKKLKAVIEEKLTPILCIGETKEEREQGKTESILKNQIVSGLKQVSNLRFSQTVIAYEPIWAIGTGKPCDVEEAQKIGLLIRKIISRLYTNTLANQGSRAKREVLISRLYTNTLANQGSRAKREVLISRVYNLTISKNLRILYGGSVNSKNAAGYIKEAGLQGLLVGGASLKAKEFVKIVKTVI